jgi:predicted amidophosphoribosyltransferase
MAPLVTGAAALVPVPRALLRRWRYGVDPAHELTWAVASLTGVPVVDALASDWWHPARAGVATRRRGVPRLRRRRPVPPAAVLVDDVLTTGATLTAAAAALDGARMRAVVATASPGTARVFPGSI